MPEVRVDPLTGLKTIIAGERADRPGGGFDVAARRRRSTPSADPFLPGHEDQTPPEVYRVPGRPTARLARARRSRTCIPRWIQSRAQPERDANPDLFTAQPALGAHEVIVNAPEPVTSLAELSVEQVALAVDDVARAHARPRAAPPAGT